LHYQFVGLRARFAALALASASELLCIRHQDRRRLAALSSPTIEIAGPQHSTERRETAMNTSHEMPETSHETLEPDRQGKVGWAVLWLLGVPLPILLVLYFLTGGGCNGG